MDTNALTSIVMLETIWETRKKDLLDLLMPFVRYSVSKSYSPGDLIDVRKVHLEMKNTFGFNDIPISVIEKIMHRDKTTFKKDNHEYYLVTELDQFADELEKRKSECESIVSHIGSELSDYFSVHCRYNKHLTIEDSVVSLQKFFSRYGLNVGLNYLEEEMLTPKDNEIAFHISQYILDKKQNNAKEYYDIIKLVKGYYLQTAIFLQSDNSSIAQASYTDLSFYFDTKYLLRLLKYETDDDYNNAVELYNSLKAQRGSFYYFSHTRQEINNILTAYQLSMNDIKKTFSLTNLYENNYSRSGIDRLKSTWPSTLAVNYNIREKEIPGYKTNKDGGVKVDSVIDELELKQYLLKNNPSWKREDSIENDIRSAVAVHILRDGSTNSDIEKCKALFVSPNSSLVRYINQYYFNEVSKDSFPLMITDTDLSALTWIKHGGTSKLPELELLKLAYMSSQPAPELLEKFSSVLQQMSNEGTITEEIARILRADKYTQKELLQKSFDPKGFSMDKEYVLNAKQAYDKRIISTAENDYISKSIRIKSKQYENADKKARDEANKQADTLYKRLRLSSIIGLIIIAVIAMIGAIESVDHVTIFIPSIIFVAFSILSIIDLIFSFHKLLDRLLRRLKANKMDKTYLKKREEYMSIIEKNNNHS